MAGKFISKKNINFLLYDVFDVVSLTKHDYYAAHNRKIFDMVIDATVKLAKDLMWPNFEEMDRNPPELVDGIVKVHPVVRDVLRECGRGGWISSSFPADHGGEQLPVIISHLTRFIFAAANYSAGVYADLCAGAAHLIISFGNRKLIDTYAPNLLSGIWQGTMALTEPQAGSSLTDIATTAYPAEDGTYRIIGQKIFISAGDHDAADNVIHLMLAKIDGAPGGIKGISLFVVPKKRIDENGGLVPNDIRVTQIYHKLGYKGTPLTELSIGDQGDCHGYLVGEKHKGLMYMFQMMNEARIEVGLGACGIATAAYYASLDYAAARPQGRRIMEKDPNLPQMPIINHADVKRMLLFQRSIIEGSLSLLMQCCMYADLELISQNDLKEKYRLLLEILTPVAKTFPSEMGILSVSTGLQCFGGYGYCDDFPMEQYFRDSRIHPIHEGTTGIQGMDLLGRKIVMKNGRAMTLFIEEVEKTIQAAESDEVLKPYAAQLKDAVNILQNVTLHLVGIAQKKGPEAYLADATVFLRFFGLITIAWQWLLQAVAVTGKSNQKQTGARADFYTGKMFTFKYFFVYEFPQISGLAHCLMNKNELTINMKTDFFSD